jgi:hypothetical protein
MQKLILYMGEDPDIEHRYLLIVKAFGTFEELCRIRADLCAKGFGIYTINDDTIEALYLGDNM